jgi:tetratricopeptide (TPR) repeat protein
MSRLFRVIFSAARTGLLLLVAILLLQTSSYAQAGGPNVVFGDVHVDDSQAPRGQTGTLTFRILLYSDSGTLLDQQIVINNGRYRFLNVRNGKYDVAIEYENGEIGRMRITVQSTLRTDLRYDIALELKPDPFIGSRPKPATIYAEDTYQRKAATKAQFEEASQEISKKNYGRAITLLRQVLSVDGGDFQAWTELGTVYLFQQNQDEAEKAYLKALEVRPAFVLALIDLGRLYLLQKKFDKAIEVLDLAVKTRPQSAEANHNLGEAYLQIKKGSIAVGYLNEALRLDPQGMADVRLRLAALYNGAGMKDKAAAEYQQFLKTKPDYPDRKKLEEYISANKKP